MRTTTRLNTLKFYRWKRKHEEHRAEYMKAWRVAHKEITHALNVTWNKKHRKAYYQNNLDKLREANNKSYAKSVGLTRSEMMARIKSVSALEKASYQVAYKRAGCLLRHQPKGIFGKPDYANKTQKIAVFIHGCWWHVCPSHFKLPKTNTAFWLAKFRRNVARHKEVDKTLRAAGWTVFVIWEHEVRKMRRLRPVSGHFDAFAPIKTLLTPFRHQKQSTGRPNGEI